MCKTFQISIENVGSHLLLKVTSTGCDLAGRKIGSADSVQPCWVQIVCPSLFIALAMAAISAESENITRIGEW